MNDLVDVNKAIEGVYSLEEWHRNGKVFLFPEIVGPVYSSRWYDFRYCYGQYDSA